MALIKRTLCFQPATAFVLPVHAASRQCVLGILNRHRLYLVLLPVAHSTGANCLNSKKMAFLVALTAAVAAKGGRFPSSNRLRLLSLILSIFFRLSPKTSAHCSG